MTPAVWIDGENRVAALAALRARVRRLEGSVRVGAEVVSTGFAAIDQALPERGLARGGLHELVAEVGNRAAMLGFAVRLLARLGATGPILWCLGECDLYAPGLHHFGLAADRLILVRARPAADLLWAMEEGLKTPGLAAVIGEPQTLDLAASRRLQLAAERGRGLGLLLRLIPAGQAGATVALTRWRIAAAPSLVRGQGLAVPADFGLMRARWRVDLERCRGAVLADESGYGRWLVEAGDAADSVAVVETLADRQDTATGPAVRAG